MYVIKTAVWVVDCKQEKAVVFVLWDNVIQQSELLVFEEVENLDLLLIAVKIINKTIIPLVWRSQPKYTIPWWAFILEYLLIVLSYFGNVLRIRLVVVVVTDFTGLFLVSFQVLGPRSFNCLGCLVVDVANLLPQLPSYLFLQFIGQFAESLLSQQLLFTHARFLLFLLFYHQDVLLDGGAEDRFLVLHFVNDNLW